MRDELKKFSRKDVTISKGATKIIARFVYKAVEDLIERADDYRSKWRADELSSGEESSSSDLELLDTNDVIQAFRDLEDRYLLTDRDTESLFSRLSQSITPINSDIARILLSNGISARRWEESAAQFISIYIKLLTRELLRQCLALLDPQSKRISGEDAKNAVRIRQTSTRG